MKIDYQAAGVNLKVAQNIINEMKPSIEQTFSKNVQTRLGHFAGIYDLKEMIQAYNNPVLVQSMDGIGTKSMLARNASQYRSLGIDLVSATTNDILVLGAKPLTLLDYIASDKLSHETIKNILLGITDSCREHHISLLGGEIAEMPGIYRSGEYDIVGTMTGVVEKEKAILGVHIQPGDYVFGLESNGLHTNGYSLARKLLLEQGLYTLDSYLPDCQQTLGDILLKPHFNYSQPILRCLEGGGLIHGMAHITGGGWFENIPRILPSHCAVEIQLGSWPIPNIFSLLQQLSHLETIEMYEIFNMGIGYILIGPEQLKHYDYSPYTLYSLGTVVEGLQTVQLKC